MKQYFEEEYDDEATEADIERAFKKQEPVYDEMKELKIQKLKLEIEHMKGQKRRDETKFGLACAALIIGPSLLPKQSGEW